MNGIRNKSGMAPIVPWLALTMLSLSTSVRADMACTDWKNLTIPATGNGSTAGATYTVVIKDASWEAPSSGPRYCMLRGQVGNINFEMRLPEGWNTKLFFQGGFGLDGIVDRAVGFLGGAQLDNALARSYAVVSMDSGHQVVGDMLNSLSYGSYSVFGLDPVKRTDFAYKAVGTVTDVAKRILGLHYGASLSKSYFVGCSNGGRQGFMAATRFSDKFEGVLAGAPALSITKMMLQAAWDAQKMSTIASTPSAALTRDDMTVVANKVRTVCDGLDGATDGMVADTAKCQTRLVETGFPNSIACQGGTTSNCIPPTKAAVLSAMMGGPRTSAGLPLYTHWPWDPAMSTVDDFNSWRTWRFASDIGLGYPVATWVGGGALAQVTNNDPVQNFNGSSTGSWNYLKGYNLNEVELRMDRARPDLGFVAPNAELNVPDPTNLGAFRDKGGRMIVYIGSGDPAVSPNEITNWYKALMARDPRHSEYSRLYVVPGMTHCSGGPAADQFDLFKVLDDWAVSQTSPDAKPIIASIRQNNNSIPGPWGWNVDRKRPLCKYPLVARYVGDKFFTNYVPASNFACQP